MRSGLPARVPLAGLLVLGLGTVCAGAAPPHIVKRGQMLMGTVVQVTAAADDEETAARAADAALKEIRRLEERLSTWIPTSDLSRVNAAAGGRPVEVGPEAYELVARSLEMARQTEGAFSIAVGPAVQAWNVAERPRVPDDAELAELRPLTELSQIVLDPGKRTIQLLKAGMRLDVGGIGKGYAADRAIVAMQSAGARAGVVALSGDIKTFGELGGPYVFGVQHPRNEHALLGTLPLRNQAVSTAGDYERFFDKDGVRYHHILDPRTLKPARGCQSVTIVAREGVTADGLDTGIFVLGPERGMALIETLPDVEGIIVAADGRVLVSSGLVGRFTREPN
jgi:thiamine biosynthesis lipoprotein